jgi:hypothetical protein
VATKLYVICEYVWDYSDRLYYRSENAGSEPRKAYASKEKAEVDCKARNINTLQTHWGAHADAEEIAKYVSEGRWDNLVGDGSGREALFKLFNEYDVRITNTEFIEIDAPAEPLPYAFFERLEDLVIFSFYCVTVVEAELE